MTQVITEIEEKVAKYNQLKEEIFQVERELKTNLTELDKNAFNGKTWHEYLSTLDETINVNDSMEIKRQSYLLTGTLQLSDGVELTLSGVIYKDTERCRSTIHYKETDRYQSDKIPKKYINQAEALRAEMAKYKVERPSDKYSKEAGLSSF